MDEQQLREIWEQVKENAKKLESCPHHNFSIDLTPDKQWGKKYKCTKCGGWVSYNEKYWYELGLKHAATEVNRKGA